MALSTNDELAIRNLVADYNRTTDDADADGFMALWVDPDEFGGYDSAAFGSMTTWEELRQFEVHHVGPGGMANGKRHQATNVVIHEIGPDEVRVSHDMLVLEVADSPHIVATGRYENGVVIRTADGWRFKSRTLTIDPGFLAAQEA